MVNIIFKKMGWDCSNPVTYVDCTIVGCSLQHIILLMPCMTRNFCNWGNFPLTLKYECVNCMVNVLSGIFVVLVIYFFEIPILKHVVVCIMIIIYSFSPWRPWSIDHWSWHSPSWARRRWFGSGRRRWGRWQTKRSLLRDDKR